MIDLLRSRFAFQLSYLHALTSDISDAQLVNQPAPGMNHPAWLLGHLAWAADFVPALLGGDPALDAAWAERYGFRSRPIPDVSLYATKGELLAILDEAHARASAALDLATPDRLAAVFPDPTFRAVMPTVGDGIVHILTTHEATHAGQLSAWRRAALLPRTTLMSFV